MKKFATLFLAFCVSLSSFAFAENISGAEEIIDSFVEAKKSATVSNAQGRENEIIYEASEYFGVGAGNSEKSGTQGLLTFDITKLNEKTDAVYLSFGCWSGMGAFKKIPKCKFTINIFGADDKTNYSRRDATHNTTIGSENMIITNDPVATVTAEQFKIYNSSKTNKPMLLAKTDIKNYVAGEKNKGKTSVTLYFVMDYKNKADENGNSSSEIQLFFSSDKTTPGSLGDAILETKPRLYSVNVKKDDDNNLKGVNITNGYLNESIKKDVTEYKIGIENKDLPFNIEYILNSDKATLNTISSGGKIGEKCEIEIISQSGIKKKYIFNLVTLEEAGYGENKGVYPEKLVSDKNALVPGGEINIRGIIKNQSLSEESFLFITYILKDKELYDYKIQEIKNIKPGFTDISEKYILPYDTENMKIVSFISDNNHPLYFIGEPVILNDNVCEFEKKEDPLYVYYKDLNINELTLGGKSTPDTYIAMYLIIGEDTSENIDINNLMYVDIVKTDDKGYFGRDVKIGSKGESYTAIATNGDRVETLSFFYSTVKEKEKAVKDIYLSETKEELKNKLKLTEKNSSYVKILQLNTSDFSYMNEDNFIDILFGLIKKEPYDENSLKKFSAIYDDALLIEKINEGKIEDITKFSQKIGLSENSLEKYNLVPDNLKSTISTKSLLDKNFKDFKSIADEFEKATIITLMSYPENPEMVGDLLIEYSKDLGIEALINDYKRLNSSKKQNIIEDIINNAPYKEILTIKNIFSQSLKKEKNKDKHENTGGGGGSSGSVSGRGDNQNIDISVNKDKKDLNSNIINNERNCKFNDLSEASWAEKSIKYLYEKNIIDGISETQFSPNSFVKKEEFIKMVDFLYNDLENNNNNREFLDVSYNMWYAPYVKKAVANDIIKGIDDNTFGIGTNLKREDAAIIISRILNLKDTDGTTTYKDDSNISDYAKNAVYALSKEGILKGDESDNFLPEKFLTRAEASQIIVNILEK